MSEKTYIFRRVDNDELVEVPFGVMMEQDSAGFIVLSDGVEAHRCVHLELDRDGRAAPVGGVMYVPVVSDSLGFTEQQFSDFERDRVANGFSGVDFKRDPSVPQFYQVHCDSWRTRDAYAAHRGYHNKSDDAGGVKLSQDDLDRAAELVGRAHYE